MNKSGAVKAAGEMLLSAERKRYFRALADSWDRWYETVYRNDPPGMTAAEYQASTEKEAARLIALLTPSARFLDLGCGDGTVLGHVAPHCAQADGADVSPKALALAKAKCRGKDNVALYPVEDLRLGFADASYDLVFCHLMLSEMDIEPALAYMREAARVLKPGGRFVFDLPDLAHAANLERVLAWESTNWPSTNRPRFWTAEAIEAVLPRLGFRIERMARGRWFDVQAVKL